jgi:hypothetical protein
MPANMTAAKEKGLEAEHRPDAPLDPTMVLFNPVIEVLALTDADRLQ